MTPERRSQTGSEQNKLDLLSLLIILALTGCTGSETSITLTPTANLLSSPTQVATPSFAQPVSSSTTTPSPTQIPPTTVPPPSPSTTFTFTPTPTSIPSATPTSTSTSTSTPSAQSSCEVETPNVAGDSGTIEHVVIISIDGLRPDAWEQSDTPNLDALRAKGTYTAEARTVLPSVTLVAHASMLGGMSPDKHGIYWNVNNLDLGKINGPTLFSVAHEANLSTAMVVGKPRLEHLVLPDSVDCYDYAGFTDRKVVDHAVEVIQTGLPHIFFIHLPDVDSAGHTRGWMSASQLTTIGSTDSLIGEIVAALEAGGYLEYTLLIITADHGGSDSSHGSDSPEDMTIPWLAVGPGVLAGITLQSEIVIYDTAATALQAFNIPIPDEWNGRPVLEIFDGESKNEGATGEAK